MENSSHTLVTLVLVGAAIWAGAILLHRQAAAAAAQGSSISNPIAKVADWIAGTSDHYLGKIPIVGKPVSAMLNAPVLNITRGDWKGTLKSIATGGVTDVGRALGINWP